MLIIQHHISMWRVNKLMPMHALKKTQCCVLTLYNASPLPLSKQAFFYLNSLGCVILSLTFSPDDQTLVMKQQVLTRGEQWEKKRWTHTGECNRVCEIKQPSLVLSDCLNHFPWWSLWRQNGHVNWSGMPANTHLYIQSTHIYSTWTQTHEVQILLKS